MVLAEAIEAIDEVGVDRIAAWILKLVGQLTAGTPNDRLLSPVAPKSGLVTIDVDDPEATVDRLASEGIVVLALPAPDAIRASIHAVNTQAEVEQLLDVLESEGS